MSEEKNKTAEKVENKTIDELEALKAAIIEEAKAESKKIIEEAKAEARAEVAKVAEKVDEKPYQETEEEIAAANELVEVRLFKDKDRYKDDVLVIINGQSYLIKRGVTAKVPRKVLDVLNCSDMQTGVAADVIGGYEEAYEKSKSALE